MSTKNPPNAYIVVSNVGAMANAIDKDGARQEIMYPKLTITYYFNSIIKHNT